MDPQIIFLAIKELSPDSEFSFSSDDLSTLKWHNEGAPRPSDEDILAHCKVVIKNLKTKAATDSAAKTALLERLGITEDEAKLLLS